MSFTEMMLSGRGPGVIGLVMALIVLLGFGVLFMFATDEGFQGGDRSIESIIAHQAKEIEFSKGVIESGSKLLSEAPARLTRAKELERLKRANLALKETTVTLGKNIGSGHAEVISINNCFDAYKDQYRAYVRGKAKGEVMATLQTLSGAVYKNVSIREVTAVGIQIRHDDGHKRIPFEELPEAMKDHFQFDPKQKAAAVASEQAKWNEHEAAVSVANVASDRKLAEQKAKELEGLRDQNVRTLAIKESRGHSLSEEIRNLEEAITKELEKRLSNAPQMRRQLANKQSELSALQADVARMRAQLSN